MESGIYKIEINGGVYIGSATSIYQRKHRHLHDLKNNKHINSKLQNKFNKYGESEFVFSVLEYCDKSKLIDREQFYIDKLMPSLNILKNAGSSYGYKHKSSTIEKFKETRKGKQNSLGRVLSYETKKKISKKAKERGIPKQCVEAAKRKNKGKKHSKQLRDKLALIQCKLNVTDVLAIREKYKNGFLQKDLAKEYNVSQRVISKVVNKIGIYGTHPFL